MAIQKFTPIRENISPRELRGEKAPRVLLALLLGLCLIPALRAYPKTNSLIFLY